MKNSIFGIILVCFAFVSCSTNEDSLQKIDQNIHFYFKNNSGTDLLRPSKIGSFTTISLNDMLAETDLPPVNFSLKTNADSVFYIDYLAGAKRELVSGGDSGEKIYRSQLVVALTKKLTDSTFTTPDNDTLEIFYRWNPSVFEVSKVFYNKELKFTKNSQEPNVVTIVK